MSKIYSWLECQEHLRSHFNSIGHTNDKYIFVWRLMGQIVNNRFKNQAKLIFSIYIFCYKPTVISVLKTINYHPVTIGLLPQCLSSIQHIQYINPTPIWSVPLGWKLDRFISRKYVHATCLNNRGFHMSKQIQPQQKWAQYETLAGLGLLSVAVYGFFQGKCIQFPQIKETKLGKW